MMKGDCPKCGEHKEDLTSEEWLRGYCNDCYVKKYTCDGCGKLVTDPWSLYFVPGKGTGHKECMEG